MSKRENKSLPIVYVEKNVTSPQIFVLIGTADLISLWLVSKVNVQLYDRFRNENGSSIFIFSNWVIYIQFFWTMLYKPGYWLEHWKANIIAISDSLSLIYQFDWKMFINLITSPNILVTFFIYYVFIFQLFLLSKLLNLWFCFFFRTHIKIRPSRILDQS